MAPATRHAQFILEGHHQTNQKHTPVFCKDMYVNGVHISPHTCLNSQSQIAIDSAIFPEGTTGSQLDVLARRALWRDGLNYMVHYFFDVGLTIN